MACHYCRYKTLSQKSCRQGYSHAPSTQRPARALQPFKTSPRPIKDEDQTVQVISRLFVLYSRGIHPATEIVHPRMGVG